MESVLLHDEANQLRVFFHADYSPASWACSLVRGVALVAHTASLSLMLTGFSLVRGELLDTQSSPLPVLLLTRLTPARGVPLAAHAALLSLLIPRLFSC